MYAKLASVGFPVLAVITIALGVAAWSDGKSAECKRMDEEVSRWIEFFPEQPTPIDLDRMKSVVEIRDSVCN